MHQHHHCLHRCRCHDDDDVVVVVVAAAPAADDYVADYDGVHSHFRYHGIETAGMY